MSPRLLRFLLVYVLVGLTFTALASGATERVIQRASSDGRAGTCCQRFDVDGAASPGPGSHGEEVGGLGASIIGHEPSALVTMLRGRPALWFLPTVSQESGAALVQQAVQKGLHRFMELQD